MNKIAPIILRFGGWAFTAITAAISGIVIIATAAEIKTWQQLKSLVTFDYMSFVDSLNAGSFANDFFVAVGLLAASCVTWIILTYRSPAKTPRAILVFILLFVAFCLVYGVEHTRVETIPNYLR